MNKLASDTANNTVLVCRGLRKVFHQGTVEVPVLLDVDFEELKGEMARFMPLGLLIGVILLMQLGIAFGSWTSADGVDMVATPVAGEVENTRALNAG